MTDIKAAQRQLNQKVMGKPGVSGTAIGERAPGEACLKVYVSDDKARKAVPRSVGGFPVMVEKSGKFRRLDG